MRERIGGRITGISGPTVSVDLGGLKLYERVHVGGAMLTGEVVKVERGSAVVQVYEDTRGLSVGEPVKGVGMPLTVRLGPGLLSGMFDGLQRPLVNLRESLGPFMRGGKEIYALDYLKPWHFTPLVKAGDVVERGSILGQVTEGPFTHFIPVGYEPGGTIASIREGEFSLNEALGSFEDERPIVGCHEWAVRVPRPYRKKRLPKKPLITGQRCIDFLFPLARGGVAVFPGGFGTGKTILEQSIAKFADADIVIYVGCGERGNEMADLIGEMQELSDPWTGKQLMDRTILVVNTSNMPVAAREASIYTGVTMGEYYRDMGYHVLLLADSLSRWAEALREISSSLGEMPGEEGYPTYLSSRIAGFVERAGVVETLSGKIGSLTMVLAVSPPGGDFTEPVTQACLRTAGTFLMLDTALAHRRHFPAIHWFQSYSLYGGDLAEYFRQNVTEQWGELLQRCRAILQEEETLREVGEIVGAEGMQDGDRLTMATGERVRMEFLSQNAYGDDAFSAPERSVGILRDIMEAHDRRMRRLDDGVPYDQRDAEDRT